MGEPHAETRSNAVLAPEGVVLPAEVVLEAKQWLAGKLGAYPCMDCCPNIFISQNEAGEWVADVHHDETCPDLTAIL